jgi:general secretion pathway protein G
MLRSKIAKARSDESGFTLIELLIVIVVLGILAGVVVFGVGTFRADSQVAANCANAKTVEVASQAFIAKSPTGTPALTVQALVDAKYLKTLPVPAVTYAGATGEVTFPAGCTA